MVHDISENTRFVDDTRTVITSPETRHQPVFQDPEIVSFGVDAVEKLKKAVFQRRK